MQEQKVMPENIKGPRRWAKGDSRVAKYLGVAVMTISRWDRKPEMKFPPPIIINKMKFRDLDEIDAWVSGHAGIELDASGISRARRIKQEKRAGRAQGRQLGG
jgi:hypothetical protein